MRQRVFRPGDKVRTIDGPRAGEITTVVSGPEEFYRKDGQSSCGGIRNGDLAYVIGLASVLGADRVMALPSWLEPYDDGREPLADSEVDDWVRRLVRPRTVEA